MGHRLKVAVIGAGITGLSAAWLLGPMFDVTLFEADDRLGGHSNTVDVHGPDGRCPVDTGFIVYNTAAYPNLIALFEHLQVPVAPTDMGFAVSLNDGGYEYAGTGLSGLVGQARNLVSAAHWQLMRDIFRFFREASAPAAANTDPAVTLGDWLTSNGYSKQFIDAHIVPMGAAIWSTPASEMLAFPFAAFARFFANHGLLQTFKRPPWRTVNGGSREYVMRLAAAFEGRILTANPVTSVKTAAGPSGKSIVRVATAGGGSGTFDAALLACHADDAVRLACGPGTAAGDVLSKFRYADNQAILHTDAGQMPRRRALWSAWNYIGTARDGARTGASAGASAGASEGAESQTLSVTYWMNKLQPLPTTTNYFVTLNPCRPVDPKAIVQSFAYRHPMFDAAALDAQAKLPGLQGRNSLWFAGSYAGYGFHEDGLQSGLAAAEHLSATLGAPVERPWTWDATRSRVARMAPVIAEAAQ